MGGLKSDDDETGSVGFMSSAVLYPVEARCDRCAAVVSLSHLWSEARCRESLASANDERPPRLWWLCAGGGVGVGNM